MTDVLTLSENDYSGYGNVRSTVKEGRQIFICSAAITKGNAVMIDSANAGKVCITDGVKKFIGIAETSTTADGEPVTVIVGKGMRVTAKSASAIAAGIMIGGAASGKVDDIAATGAGDVADAAGITAQIGNTRAISAQALTTVTAADKEVEIVLL